MHKNYNRKGPSLFQRALEFISTLTFRLRWKHLRRRGETPNYLYLRGGAKSLEYSDKEFSTVSNIKPAKIKPSVVISPQLNSGAPFEPPPISVEKHDVEEPAGTGQQQISEDSGNSWEDDPATPCPVTPEQIEESLPVSVQTETVEQKTPVETVPSSKKKRTNPGRQGRGEDRRNQMPLLFE